MKIFEIQKKKNETQQKRVKEPPVVSGGGIFGSMIKMRKDPYKFTKEAKEKYGDVFSISGPFGAFKSVVFLSEEARLKILKAPEKEMNIGKGVGTLLTVNCNSQNLQFAKSYE